MSTRVFKPISSLSEMPKIRSSSLLEGRLTTYKGIPKVRRSLFNPDPEETKRFLKEEFAKLAVNNRDKWDFDFIEGRPQTAKGRYEWTVLAASSETPKLDVLMRPAKRFVNIQDISEEFYPPIQSSSESVLEDDQMSTTSDDVINIQIPKKQSLITDFMQMRKRIEERSLKKVDSSSTPSQPLKKARMSLVDSAS